MVAPAEVTGDGMRWIPVKNLLMKYCLCCKELGVQILCEVFRRKVITDENKTLKSLCRVGVYVTVVDPLAGVVNSSKGKGGIGVGLGQIISTNILFRCKLPCVWFEGKKWLKITTLHVRNIFGMPWFTPAMFLPLQQLSLTLDWTRKIQNPPWSILGKERMKWSSSDRLALQSRWSLRWPRVVSSLTREQNQELLEGWEKSQEKEIKI